MQSKSLIAIKALDIYELNRLEKFVQSPYFNVNERITALFLFYLQSVKSDSNNEYTKLEIWQDICPEQEFNDQKFRKLNSDLLKLIEQFLAQEQFQSNPLHKANYLLKAISTRKLEKLYNSSISSARRLSDYHLERTASFYYYQYQIEKNLYNLSTEFEKKAKASKAVINISQIAENLDHFYLAEKIKYYCTSIALKNIIDIEENVLFIDDIIKQIENIDYQNIPPIAIYYQIYLTYQDSDNEAHFSKLKELVDKYLDIFPRAEAKDIYGACLNYCATKVNKGEHKYFNEMFKLYEYGLESKILIEHNRLVPSFFRNICITSLRLKKYDWTEKFIANYSPLIEEKFRHNAVIFNSARLETYKKNFQKVIELLREVTFDDIFYELSSKALQIVAYYELDEVEVLHSFLSSFKIFLKRNTRIPQRRKNNYLQLVKFTTKLIKLEPRDKEKIQALKIEIESSENITDKPWLLEKIAELQGKPIPSALPA